MVDRGEHDLVRGDRVRFRVGGGDRGRVGARARAMVRAMVGGGQL